VILGLCIQISFSYFLGTLQKNTNKRKVCIVFFFPSDRFTIQLCLHWCSSRRFFYCLCWISMSYQVAGFLFLSAIYFLIRLLSQTDVPKIKGLPEIPGWPIFGSLIELGDQHAKVCQRWARKYGPVFQVRLGNRVGAKTVFLIWINNPRRKESTLSSPAQNV
jgi:hypothetical protein